MLICFGVMMILGMRMGKLSMEKSAEPLDIVANGFREHGKGLSDVIARLREIVEGSGVDEEYSRKVSDIQKRFSSLQVEISSLISSLSSSATASNARGEYLRGPPVIIRCKQWEDFKVQALNPSTVSFLYRAEERAFQVDALKEGRVYTFSGQLPSDAALLKTWLSKELSVEEGRVLEGVLAIG